MDDICVSRKHQFKLISQLTLTDTLGTTPDIPMEEFVGGTIYIPAGSHITGLAFYGSPRQKGNNDPVTSAFNPDTALVYYALTNSIGVAVTLTVAAGKCYNLPADIFGFGSMKMVGTFSSGSTDTAELSKKS